MNVFLIVSLACVVYGLISKKEDFLQFGIFILVILIIPQITSYIPIFTRFQRRLLNWMLIMFAFYLIRNQFGNR